MENKLPEYTPVRHKKDGYKGWIHGITKMQELFTGQNKCDWQYTITIDGFELKHVAPEEDLEVIKDSREFPFFINEIYNMESGYTEETRMHMLGYKITDRSWYERHNILINVCIPILGPREVVETIADLMFTRLPNEAIAERYRNALLAWRNDLNMVLDRYHDDLKLENTRLFEYIDDVINKTVTLLFLPEEKNT